MAVGRHSWRQVAVHTSPFDPPTATPCPRRGGLVQNWTELNPLWVWGTGESKGMWAGGGGGGGLGRLGPWLTRVGGGLAWAAHELVQYDAAAEPRPFTTRPCSRIHSRLSLRTLIFFLLRTALKDSPQGPPTANRQPPPTADSQPPTATKH